MPGLRGARLSVRGAPPRPQRRVPCLRRPGGVGARPPHRSPARRPPPRRAPPRQPAERRNGAGKATVPSVGPVSGEGRTGRGPGRRPSRKRREPLAPLVHGGVRALFSSPGRAEPSAAEPGTPRSETPGLGVTALRGGPRYYMSVPGYTAERKTAALRAGGPATPSPRPAPAVMGGPEVCSMNRAARSRRRGRGPARDIPLRPLSPKGERPVTGGRPPRRPRPRQPRRRSLSSGIRRPRCRRTG